jgi:tRNA A-37 threonylcarbamoyl transferase component Bud32
MAAIFHARMRGGNAQRADSDAEATWTGEIATVGTETLGTKVSVPPEIARRQAVLAAAARGFEDAMAAREVAAMRGFIKLVLALSAAVVLAVPLLDLDRVQMFTLGAGVVICVTAALRTVGPIRRGRLSPGDILLVGLACMIGGSAGIYSFGFFSPAPLATIMGVFFFGLQRDRRVALATFVGTIIVQSIVMLAVIYDVIEDRGVINADHVSVRHKLVSVALVQTVFCLTFYLARATHRAIMASARRLEESTRQLAQREALLDEARRELERVLEVGGPGRFTEQRLGAWELGVLCGRGAMGDVYVATHVVTGERAAVKLLTRDSARDPDSVRRFLREARIAGSIDVPNVVRVLEVGSDDAPVPFIAMELLEGRDLASILRKEKRLEPCEVIAMLRQIALGLDAAHAVGIVHRDLKPQNLYRAEAPGQVPVWKILDFGVSRIVDVDSSLTRGQAIGTPSYMSPEQARGGEVDQRADLFALGVLAYRALTGRPPFAGSEVPQILYRVVYGMPPRASEIAAVPAAVDDVLAVALAKRPEDRFATATDFVETLAAAFEEQVTPEIRERAKRLTSRLPWGRELTEHAS